MRKRAAVVPEGEAYSLCIFILAYYQEKVKSLVAGLARWWGRGSGENGHSSDYCRRTG